jgi:cell division protein ZapA
MNKVKVIICGKEYTLQTNDEPTYVYGLARKLEKSIGEIVNRNTNISVHSAAVMISLSTMDELIKQKEDMDNLRTQVKEYVDEAGRARLEKDAALREIEKLKDTVKKLEDNLKFKKLKDNI